MKIQTGLMVLRYDWFICNPRHAFREISWLKQYKAIAAMFGLPIFIQHGGCDVRASQEVLKNTFLIDH